MQLKKLGCCQEGWNEHPITGLNGWIFENLVAHLIKQEIPSANIETQIAFSGRAKVDLLINHKIAIELKVAGVYGEDSIKRLKKYREYVEKEKNGKKRSWTYLYLTLAETYEKYYEGTKDVFDPENAFFLDRENGDWNRFIKRIIELEKAR